MLNLECKGWLIKSRMIVALAYLLIILLSTFFIFGRKEITLLRGSTFLKLNLVIAVLLVIHATLKPIDGWLIPFAAYLLIASIFAFLNRDTWYFFTSNPAEVMGPLEASFSMILLPFEKVSGGYILKLADNPVRINIDYAFPSLYSVRFGGGGKIKKVEVLKSLLVKKFRKVFPRLIIKV